MPKGAKQKPLAITENNYGPLSYNPSRKQALSVDGGTPQDQRKLEAANFVKRLKKEKLEREQSLKFMTDAKDNHFLKKL